MVGSKGQVQFSARRQQISKRFVFHSNHSSRDTYRNLLFSLAITTIGYNKFERGNLTYQAPSGGAGATSQDNNNKSEAQGRDPSPPPMLPTLKTVSDDGSRYVVSYEDL